jgi:ribosomal protein S5
MGAQICQRIAKRRTTDVGVQGHSISFTTQFLEAAGVKNILTKSLRRDNPHNVVRATFEALNSLRSLSDIAKSRGKTVSDLHA